MLITKNRLIIGGLICAIAAGATLDFGSEHIPRYEHFIAYQDGAKIAEANGVHLERKGTDLEYYHRYENLHPRRLLRAFDPASHIVILTGPEQKK